VALSVAALLEDWSASGSDSALNILPNKKFEGNTMKIHTLLLSTFGLLLSSGAAVWACPTCRPLVKAGVYQSNFSSNLLVLLLPLAVLGLLVATVHLYSDRLFSFKETGE
jgi:hypothetical protein